jgi:hypothetical protein
VGNPAEETYCYPNDQILLLRAVLSTVNCDSPAISQVGLDFRLAQAIDFLAGRESCFFIASVSFSKSKRGLQADRQ